MKLPENYAVSKKKKLPPKVSNVFSVAGGY
jgi:hypothetical protein